MIYGLYHSAAGMLTNEYRQSVFANNIANADTVGFKRDMATFAERTPAWATGEREGPSAASLAGLSGGMWLGATTTDHTEAAKTKTGNWHDVALEGPGFLAVQVDGQRLFTRDGRLMMDADGNLVAVSDGSPVLGRGGMPIRLNPRAGQTSIDSDGRISQDGGVVAELDVVDFANYEALRKVGAARFAAAEDEALPAMALVRSGYVEQSGAQPLTELVSMIEASRAYQINTRMISLQDAGVGKLISTLLKD